MDFLHTVYFFFGLQGIIVALLVVADGIQKRSARKFLGIYLFSFSVIILSWVGYWEGYHKMYRLLLAYPVPLSFLLAPTAYFYIREKPGVSPVSYHLFLFYLGLLLIFFVQLTSLNGEDLINFRPIFATLPYIRMLQIGIYIFSW